MSPFIYESDDYDDEEVTEGGIEKGNYFEDTNFYYNPPSEGSESDVSEFWIDQGKSRKGSILSKRKEDQIGSKGAGMKKSSSFFKRRSKVGRQNDKEPLLEEEEDLGESIQMETLRSQYNTKPTDMEKENVAVELRNKVESRVADREFARASMNPPSYNTLFAT